MLEAWFVTPNVSRAGEARMCLAGRRSPSVTAGPGLGTMTGALALMFICALRALPAPGPHDRTSSILSLIDNGAVVCSDETGKVLIEHNPSKLFVPASILKILTAKVAIDVLGKDFRFKTAFLVDSAGVIGIQGWGDPYLVSEEIDTIARRLRSRGVHEVRRVVLDNTQFSAGLTVPGVSSSLNPYDALNGALAVNFNTIHVLRDARGVVRSAEEPTPLTPLALTKAKAVARGRQERINLAANSGECLQYAGELFAAVCRGAGMTCVNPEITTGSVGLHPWTLVYEHRNSRDLATVIEGLMKYSNNFIANQIFLTVGAEKEGYPASLEKSRALFENHIRASLGLVSEEVTVSEGSGISRNNRITARTMMQVLERFKEHSNLLDLKGNVLVKSGTLDGVYNYAGYLVTAKGLRPFVIILNQRRNTRDRVLALLREHCAG